MAKKANGKHEAPTAAPPPEKGRPEVVADLRKLLKPGWQHTLKTKVQARLTAAFWNATENATPGGSSHYKQQAQALSEGLSAVAAEAGLLLTEILIARDQAAAADPPPKPVPAPSPPPPPDGDDDEPSDDDEE